MNTRKHILVVTLLAITLVTSTAQANWFDDALAFITGDKPATQETSPILASMSSMVATPSLPTDSAAKVTHKTYSVEVSCYTSEAKQTDESPFIAARGDYVQYGMVASNMFPIGTVMKIHGVPTVSGDEIFVVRDRMNTRYQHNVDIWVADKDTCLHKIGRRTVQIEVIK